MAAWSSPLYYNVISLPSTRLQSFNHTHVPSLPLILPSLPFLPPSPSPSALPLPSPPPPVSLPFPHAAMEWSEWGSWGECSQTCQGGLRSRRRFCMGGDACGGRESQQEECNVNIPCGEQTKYPLQASHLCSVCLILTSQPSPPLAVPASSALSASLSLASPEFHLCSLA